MGRACSRESLRETSLPAHLHGMPASLAHVQGAWCERVWGSLTLTHSYIFSGVPLLMSLVLLMQVSLSNGQTWTRTHYGG